MSTVMLSLPRVGAVTRLAEGDEDNGYSKFRVQLIAAGEVERIYGKLVIPKEAVRGAVEKFNNVSAYTHSLGQHVPTYLYSEQDKVGIFDNAKVTSSDIIEADYTASKTQKAQDTVAQLEMSLDLNKPMFQQLSAVFRAKTEYIVEEDENGEETLTEIVKSIEFVRSVDFVDIGALPMRATKQLSDTGAIQWDTEEEAVFSLSEILNVHLSEKEKNMDRFTEMTLEQLQALDVEELEDAERLVVEARIAQLEAEQALAALQAEGDDDADAGDGAEDEAEDEVEVDPVEVDRTERLNAILRRQAERHFETLTESFGRDNPAIIALRETLDFDTISLSDLDRVCAPIVAHATESQDGRVRVTEDASTKIEHLARAFVRGEDLRENDTTFLSAQDFAHFRRLAGAPAHENHVDLWQEFVDGYTAVPDRILHEDDDAEHQLAVSTTTGYGVVIQNAIVQQAAIAYTESEFMRWANLLISRERTVSNFQQAKTGILGTYAEPPSVNENAAVANPTSPDSYNVLLTPVTYQNIEQVTRQSFLNDSGRAIRQLPMAFAYACARRVYREIMGGIVFSKNVDVYEGGSATDLYRTTSGAANLNSGTGTGSARGFNYTNVVTARATFASKTAYGQSNYALAGIADRNLRLVVPGPAVNDAQAMLRATLKPGTANNDANELTGEYGNISNIVPAVLGVTQDKKRWALVSDPNLMQTIFINYLLRRTPYVMRDPSGRGMFTNNRLEYKYGIDFAAGPVDWRAFYFTEQTD